ncbi:MAG TPA: hypothetical protein ENH11_09550 [Candidatus Acetothermia bacterium]|nr:hypothetical protein [Candidatus Acetothermia bacterium]
MDHIDIDVPLVTGEISQDEIFNELQEMAKYEIRRNRLAHAVAAALKIHPRYRGYTVFLSLDDLRILPPSLTCNNCLGMPIKFDGNLKAGEAYVAVELKA